MNFLAYMSFATASILVGIVMLNLNSGEYLLVCIPSFAAGFLLRRGMQ